MYGSYYVECNIIEKLNDNVKISFIDPVSSEKTIRVIKKSELEYR